MKLLSLLTWVEVTLLVGLLAAYFAGEISARSMAFTAVGVLIAFAPAAFLLLGRDTAKGKDPDRVTRAT